MRSDVEKACDLLFFLVREQVQTCTPRSKAGRLGSKEAEVTSPEVKYRVIVVFRAAEWWSNAPSAVEGGFRGRKHLTELWWWSSMSLSNPRMAREAQL